jgi:ABC-2 type transport system permease protein
VRSWYVFLFAAKQKARDRLGLALTLLTAPLFVVLYASFFSDAPSACRLALLDEDTNAAAASVHGQAASASLAGVATADGRALFVVSPVSSRAKLQQILVDGAADLGLVFARGFDAAVSEGRPPTVTLVGDATRAAFAANAALVEKALVAHLTVETQRPPLLLFEHEAVGLSGARTPFELYVPGLLVFAVIMLIFSSSMSVVRELEGGTLSRLRLTPMTALEYLVGSSILHLLLGAVSVLLTLGTASLLGFRSQGSLSLAVAIAVLASLASIGIGMFVAALTRTQTRGFLVASAAMFLLVLFSGVVFPQPKVTLAVVGGRAIDLFDVLPTTHLGAALSRVMTLGAGMGEVTYELVWLTAVALVNFALGAALLARTGRPSAQVWEGMA